MNAPLEVHPDTSSLARAVAERFITLAASSIASRGRFLVALAGGSTPREAYQTLASPELASRVDWTGVHVLWGDERCVPPDHPDSNYRMAREALLDRVPVAVGNVHRIRCELEPQLAAATYEAELRTLAGGQDESIRHGEARSLRIDLVLLGMGEDGHTASLFPGTPAVDERGRWVVAQYVPAIRAWRVTLTPVVINAAAEVVVAVSGSSKAERLRQALDTPSGAPLLPVQAIQPLDGRLCWMADAAAAALVTP